MELSIIIPVYNLEKYIADCLKSCLEQNIEDYEIICVDDGSKDNSAKILDDFLSKHPEKIKVFQKENGGVSSARNEGLNHACGNWIWFVDGDDCIKANCLGRLLNAIKQNPCDILAIQNTMFDENMDFENIMNIQSPDKEEDNIECIAFKIFKSEIINKYNLRFDETLSHGEDNIFIYEFMKRINTQYINKEVVYYYRKRMNSASRSKQLENKRKLYNSQLKQAIFYDNELRNYESKNYFTIKDIERRRELFLKRALMAMCLFEKNKRQIVMCISDLSDKGIYPAKFSASMQGTFKEKLYIAIQNNLGNKAFFMFMWRLNRFLKRERA